MKTSVKVMIAAAVVGIGSAPALAAQPPSVPSNSGTSHMPSDPGSQGQSRAKAYGKYCQGESKRHLAGERGTPFSRCVADMAALAHGKSKSPREACRNESKRHVTGEKGTSFSECVAGGRKLLRQQHRS